ncbi:MAG: hypothetical protein FJ128_13670 [Deltaproteobacteria bacterium]|nr:hypothetical protein [Deltaproteobacteria bacterium]
MELVGELAANMAKALSGGRAEDFEGLSSDLAEARQQVRELLQKMTARPIRQVVDKLEQNEPLSAEEKHLLRLWMVGDAESYAKAQNDYRAWLEEFRRLTRVVQGRAGSTGSVEDLLALQGILEDANRLAADLRHYLEEKERIARFDAAVENLSPDDCEILVNILKGKLESPLM